jgi:molybdopterin converting factor subunit 1
MKIRIRYFASLREIVERNEEILTVDEAATVANVRELLITSYPHLQPVLERCACAVNHGYVQIETPLHEGDELVFIPPVGGGSHEGFKRAPQATLRRVTWNL